MTTTTDEQTLILKTDALGRVRMPKDRREAILDAFERSGMSGQAFAAHIGVKYPTFATWVQKRRRSSGDYAGREGMSVRSASISFLEAVVESTANEDKKKEFLEIETAKGLKVRIGSKSQAELAAALIRALGEEG